MDSTGQSFPGSGIRIPAEELTKWSSRKPLFFRLALFFSAWLPRGQGLTAKWLGRTFGRGRSIVIVTPGGAKLAVDWRNLEYFTLLSVGRARGQRLIADACFSLLKPGDVFYDVGAFAGFISIEAAARFGDKIRIHAFEPQPSVSRLCAISAALNGFDRMTVHSMALGESEGTVQIHVSTYGVHASSIARGPGAQPIECPLGALDPMVERKEIEPPNVIKIDAEGAEFQIFRGAKELLRRHRPAILFEADENLERFHYTRADLLNYLRELAPYSFYVPKRIGGAVEFLPLEDPADPNVTDILARSL